MSDGHKSVFGTGYQQTTVTAEPEGGFRFSRAPGINNTEGFRTPPDGLPQRLQRLHTDPVRFIAPVDSSRELTVWHTAGDVSFATLVRAEPQSEFVRAGIQQLAAALRAFHQAPQLTSLDATVEPPSLHRFSGWLRTGDGTRASRPWRVQLRSELGRRRWDQLQAATRALAPAARSQYPVHGWMSLGSVVAGVGPSSTGRQLDVLTGTDLGWAPPELDIAWVLGELAEFAHRAVHFGYDPTPFEHLESLFSVAYGDGVDAGLVSAGKAVRVAIHSCDFANFVGWHEDLDVYPAIIAALLDHAGGLPSGTIP
ncbi:MAG TPA: hypothetical protein VHO01_05075 [Jatrophihabitans sp.]|nr:hypothetical protein [Jatrophihabitans sp.]